MKLFYSAVILTADAQFGNLSDLNLNTLLGGTGSNYDAYETFSAENMPPPPPLPDRERIREKESGAAEEATDYAAGFSELENYDSYNFGDYGDSSYSFGDYGYGDEYNFGDAGGDAYDTDDYAVAGDYEDYYDSAPAEEAADDVDYSAYSADAFDETVEEAVAEVIVEEVAAPAPAAPVAPGRPAAPVAPSSNGKQFKAPVLGGVNDADDGTAATRSCLTCLITDLSQAGSCAPQACVEANTVGFAEEDTRDYCLIEIRQTNGAFDQLEMRCATADDCVSSFLDNVNGVDPKKTDQCRPIKDDNGVATEHYSGRWANRQSVCRNCAVMSNGANSNGAYNIEVTGAGVFMYDKNSAAITDVTANSDVLTWSREMWHNTANLAFLKQD